MKKVFILLILRELVDTNALVWVQEKIIAGASMSWKVSMN